MTHQTIWPSQADFPPEFRLSEGRASGFNWKLDPLSINRAEQNKKNEHGYFMSFRNVVFAYFSNLGGPVQAIFQFRRFLGKYAFDIFAS